jgi:lipoprotein NlpI
MISSALMIVLSWFAAPGDAYKEGVAALKAGDAKAALEHLDKAITADPKHFEAYVARAAAHSKLEHYAPAAADLTKAIELRPKAAGLFQARGEVHFKLGKFAESLADFDRYLEFEPSEKNGHWQRGITCYYAGKFDEGKKQFEGYEKVDTNDVENAVWHYLCVARKDGTAKARAALLKIGKDKRVPMSQVYELFAGKLKPEDVLTASMTSGAGDELLNRQLFYAHLYLGLYYETEGDPKRALEHLEQAVEHRIGHYMWDVARVHRDLLKK